MYTRSEMREMTSEELNVIACEKNKRNLPTPGKNGAFHRLLSKKKLYHNFS